MTAISCTLLVIGAGPGGYVCAIRAGQLGLDTVIVDAGEDGGTCLNVGCIPSKALIHAAEDYARLTHAAGDHPFGLSARDPKIDLAAAMDWKDGIVGRLRTGVGGLLKRAGVRRIRGEAAFRDGKTVEVRGPDGTTTIRAEAVVIATGAAPVALPDLPFGGDVISSAGALSLREVPNRLAVVGAGYIGLEIGTAYAKLGADVTVVEAAGRILPQYDAELTRPVAANLKAHGVTLLLSTKVLGQGEGAGELRLQDADGAETVLTADKILVAVGRRPQGDPANISTLALPMDGPFIKVDAQCRTAMRGVYAIGDVTGEPMLAHRAMAQGEMVAELVAGRRRAWDHRAVPAVCFTDPEIVTVGEGPGPSGGGEGRIVARFPFTANPRALTLGAGEGFVRIVARSDSHEILGIQAVGTGVAEFAGQFSLAVEMASRLEDVAATIQAHPTLGEAFQEAALGGLGRALHI